MLAVLALIGQKKDARMQQLRAAPFPADTSFFNASRSSSVSVTLYFTTADSFP
jgi:hypothetical protein